MKAYGSPIQTTCKDLGERICMKTSQGDEEEVDAGSGDAGTVHTGDTEAESPIRDDRVLICQDYVWMLDQDCAGDKACAEISTYAGRQVRCE